MITDSTLPYYINDLVNHRKESGHNQGNFAKIIGIRREHLCGIEKGKVKPSLKLLLDMCDELGLKITLTKV